MPGSKRAELCGLAPTDTDNHLRFRTLGVTADAKIAVILPQGPENAVLCLAAMSYACCVPLNPQTRELQLVECFTTLGIGVLVTASDAGAEISNAAAAAAVLTLVVTRADDARAGEFALGHGAAPRSISQSSARNAPDDSTPVLILHTSGSTATPKAVPLTAKNLLATINNLSASLALTPESVALNMMPLFHIGGLVDLALLSLSAGGTVICTRDMTAATFYHCLAHLRPTWYQAVPTMMQDVVNYGKRKGLPVKPSSLLFCRAVSARLPSRIRDDFIAYCGVPVIEIYGMTETAGVIASSRLPPFQQKSGAVGMSAGPRIQIIDATGNRAKDGHKGEVLVAGDNVFTGYFAAADTNRAAFIGEWFRTGDEGYLDRDGHLFLTGRIKDIINRGGEKISPLQVDEYLLRHPAVADAACFALLHPTLGEEVAAAVVPTGAQRADEGELKSFLAAQLPDFMLPRQFFVLDQLPRTAAGKLQRHRLPEIVGLAENTAPIAKCAPQSPAGQLIAQLWSHILAVDDIGVDDNFFDLGGDSLKAATFIVELEAQVALHLDAGALFDHPTLREFERYMLANTGQGAARAANPSAILPAAVFADLARFMAAWPGTRATPHSLLVGQNTLGGRPPLFWGCQDQAELTELARHLGHEQPVYGFRSLYKTGQKSATNSQLAASHYAQEIQQIQPRGPYFIAGYCEAGKLAFEIAQQLTRQGQVVALLVLVEQFVAEPYAGRTALFFCPDGQHSPYRYYQQPAMGWRKCYSGDISLISLPSEHLDVFKEPQISHFAALLLEEMALAQRTRPSARFLPDLPRPLRLDPQAFRAAIAAATPRGLAPGAQLELQVTITNTSEHNWPAYDRSGIALASRWRRRSNNKVKVWRDGFSALPVPLSPGQTYRLPILVEVPAKPGAWILELDMTDQGMCWFQDKGSQALRLPINVSKLALLWQHLRKISTPSRAKES